MQPLLTQLLNLEGIKVEDYRDLGEQIILEVEGVSHSPIIFRISSLNCFDEFFS